MQERGSHDEQDRPPSDEPGRSWGDWDGRQPDATSYRQPYQQPYQEPYRQPYRPPFPYRPPTRARSGAGVLRALGIAVLGAAFVAIVAVIAGSIAYSAKHRTQTATISAQTDSGSSAPTASAASNAAAASAPASSAAPTQAVVLSLSGSGEQTTQEFTTGPDWGVTYSYDCSSLGMQGNFIVSDENDIPLANALGTSGSATTYEHGDPGRHYLQVNSECSWKIRVTDGVGG
ncbi:MAG TPA: hypothetical protein VGM10_24220 [Actinocrinis sp.]